MRASSHRRKVQRGRRNMGVILGQLASRVSRGNYRDGIPPENIRKIGGKYWKKLKPVDRQTYLKVQLFVTEDRENADPHIGDDDFQNAVIGSVDKYISIITSVMSQAYDEGKVFEWPDKLLARINTSKGAYRYANLLMDTATYMVIKDNEDSRVRRYNEDGTPKCVPLNEEALAQTFAYFDTLALGVQTVMAKTPEEQEVDLLTGLISETNVGYPYFIHQTKDNFVKMFRRFEKEFFSSYKPPFDALTVSEIFDIIRLMIKRRWYFPYVLYCRTSGGDGETRHRSVFGAHIVQKALAAVVAAGKLYAYTEEVLRQVSDCKVDDAITEKKMFCVGGCPIVGQLPWDEMFKVFLKRLPDFKDGKMKHMTPHDIKFLFDYDVGENDQKVDVFGDDFPRFDTGIIPEDLDVLRRHKFWGWIFGYVIDDLKFSEVWTGDKRLLDIIFKSGNPFTSDFGSHFHRQCEYGAAKWKRTKLKVAGALVKILAATNLSDDSIVFAIGLTPEDINEFLAPFGLEIKVGESYLYSRDQMIGFLKVYIGYVMRDGAKSYIGDPISRYYGLAHSERDIEEDVNGEEDITHADVKGLWNVTGVVKVDACISKLASYGELASQIVLSILKIVKDTALGRDVILAISRIKPDSVFKPYREDLDVGFSPTWLSALPVQELLLEKGFQ